MKAIVSEKGQVTLPKPIRDSLGIRTGTVIEFTTSGGKLVGKHAWTAAERVLTRDRGLYRKGFSGLELLEP